MSDASISADLRMRLEREAKQLVREFAGIYDPETVREEIYAAERRLPRGKVDDYRHAFAYRYAREILQSAARSKGLLATERPQVLFVCVHNAGRSQMAAGFTAALGGDQIEVLSAGSAPSDRVQPAVVDAMREVGIDLAESYPKPLSERIVQASAVVITMGCGDSCPVFPGKRYEDWQIEDPSGKPTARVREIRDEIRSRVVRLLESLGVRSAAPPAR